MVAASAAETSRCMPEDADCWYNSPRLNTIVEGDSAGGLIPPRRAVTGLFRPSCRCGVKGDD